MDFAITPEQQHLRDRCLALAAIQPPPSDFCLWQIGLHELDLDPAELLPPLRPL